MDYKEFLGDVLLFRVVRDTDSAPGIWVDRWLDQIGNDKSLSGEERDRLLIATKVAELFDDRKQWLQDEMESDLRKMMLAESHAA